MKCGSGIAVRGVAHLTTPAQNLAKNQAGFPEDDEGSEPAQNRNLGIRECDRSGSCGFGFDRGVKFDVKV